MVVTIQEILAEAVKAGASDVHVTVGIPPKMRVNGKLVTMSYAKLLPADTLALLISIMTETQRDIFEEKGEYDMSFAIKELGRFRVNAYKQRGSVALAFRLVGTTVPSPESLGIPESVVDLYQKKHGLVLVTGPTGSGKSTTLASIVDKVNNMRESHIITLEDPIEYLHHHRLSIVNQREVGLDTCSYANALRAALREDPDVIQVGEMRDFETISVAITAAETGHLVLSTLHTLGAANTVDRVIDVFPSHQQQQIRIQVANVLEAVISQQLLPEKDGVGRIPAFEVLHVTPAVRNIIREGKTHQLPSIMQTGRSLGMTTMDESIMKLVMEGRITNEVAIQFASDSDMMRNRLR